MAAVARDAWSYHAVRDTVADNLVHDVPGRDARAQALHLLLDVLGDDVVDEVGRGDAAREPGL
jgi:hypothetical protein